VEKPALSVIIPCKNEEENLPVILQALVTEQKQFAYIVEIIMIDNFSTDASAQCAEKFGVQVYFSEGTISVLRNLGARKATGDFYCFVDADVEVEPGWSKGVADCIHEQGANAETCIYGNIYNPMKETTWVEKVWYKNLISRGKLRYINGGNLIVHRDLFEKVAGFNENLVTKEDVDFCRRVLESGATLCTDDRIATVHLGYPKDIMNFFARERWHGSGEKGFSLHSFKSKPALFGLLILLTPIWLPLLLYFVGLKGLFITFFGILCITVTACSLRLKSFFLWEPVLLNILFVVYGLARALALVDAVFSPKEELDKGSA